MNTTTTLRAVAYLRASTDDQTLGPEAQRAAIEAWAAREGVHVVAWRVDQGVSGAAPIERRPALLAALEDLRTHRATRLVVAKRDRLARDVVAAAMIERLAARSGAAIVAADGVGVGDGPEAELMRGIVDLFAQYERAVIRGRTRAALQAKARRGERVGGVPFGMCLAAAGGRLVVDQAERATVDRILAMRDAGKSFAAIATALDAERVPCRGQRWHETSVRRIVVRHAAQAERAAA